MFSRQNIQECDCMIIKRLEKDIVGMATSDWLARNDIVHASTS